MTASLRLSGLLGLLSLLCLLAPARGAERPDILVADFEGKDWGDWKATGEAFGPGPARGTLPHQMPVTGFRGKGLVNSFHGGDRSTGTLTSPAFTIERTHLNFLIGGGRYPGKTCMNLLLDGKVVRTATGPNDKPGGSEHLDWQSWDVRDLAGKKVIVQIIDDHSGGWGHITVDHIVQSDRRFQAGPVHRELVLQQRYLHLPVRTGAPMRRVRLLVDGKLTEEFDIELAEEKPSFLVFRDGAAWKGKTVRLETLLPADSRALKGIRQADEVPGEKDLYQEKHRPGFHFTSRRGWLNDPNGLVYFQGEWHLFYQHNPFGWNWGNMHWGHAVSKDLVHWQELATAIKPRTFGDWAFSGSAVVDTGNTGGFQTGSEPALVAAFTSTGRGECIVFSNDRGRTWQEFSGNPVVKHVGRDPRLLWHEASKQWVMAVYDELSGKKWIAFHTSPDLRKWKFQSRIEGYYECPDLFEMPVEGKPGLKKWILYAADGKYVVGDFDGRKFSVDSGKHTLWRGNFYAAQTFSDAPDGRRIHIGWGQGITFPGMPFNQQMTIPCALTLRTTPEGLRMVAWPVQEVALLHGKKHDWKDLTLEPKQNPLAKIEGEQFDIQVEIAVGGAEAFGFSVREIPVVYDVKKATLTCKGQVMPLQAIEGRVRLRLLVDRGSIEVFGNDGVVAASVAAVVPETKRALEVFSRGGNTVVSRLEVIELASAWPKVER